jgi:Rrf2 family protein
MVHIASQKTNLPLASHEVAHARRIPERFLLKVLKPLVSAGLLLSVKGPRGGYRLAVPANQITMLQIVEAVEGPIRGMSSFHAEGSNHALDKHLDQVCHQAAEQMRKQLNGVRLSSMANL